MQGLDARKRFSIPKAYSIIPTSGRNLLTIRTVGYALNAAVKRLDGFSQLAGRNVPQTDDGVPTAARDRVSVRTESHGNRITPVPFELVQFLTGFDIP